MDAGVEGNSSEQVKMSRKRETFCRSLEPVSFATSCLRSPITQLSNKKGKRLYKVHEVRIGRRKLRESARELKFA